MNKNYIYLLIFSFLGGVLFHSIFLNFHFHQSLLVFCLLLLIIISFIGFKWVIIFSLSVLFFFFGFFRFEASIHHNQKYILDYFSEQKIEVELEGLIIERPLVDDLLKKKVVVEVHSLVLGDKKEKIDTKIYLTIYDSNDYHYGQKIKFKVIPKKPKSFITDNERKFDYEHFLEKDSIYYIGKTYHVDVLSEKNNTFISHLYSLKDKLLFQIYRNIPRPESSLLAGILLGEKTALGDKLEDNFRTTGLMHIVVLSGYNVSIVIIAIMIVLAFLPLYIRSIIAVLGIISFALLVGAGPTVIRASIMALFIVLSRVIGKQYDIKYILLLTGFFMVLYNPWVLYFDISFQFSFLATYGLIVFMPILEEKLRFLPTKFALRESASATISAQIMVAPLILFYIGDVSFISIVVNMLVLFIIPITMLFGFLTAIIGFILPYIAHIISIPTTFFLKYIIFLVDLFSKVPFAKVSFSTFSFLWIIVYYAIIYYFFFIKPVGYYEFFNKIKNRSTGLFESSSEK